LESMRLQTLRPPHYCQHCDLRYELQWFHRSQDRCFFCMRFRTPNMTRYALLYETQWYFIQSGEQDARLFYESYFYYLHRWADRFHLPFTDREAQYQADLLRDLPSPPAL
jgi:hypothetical protein